MVKPLQINIGQNFISPIATKNKIAKNSLIIRRNSLKRGRAQMS